MTAKHTPGPWVVVSESLDQHSRAAFNPWLRILIGTPPPTVSLSGGREVITGRFIATITDHVATEADEAETRANARILAAAPDLYEALRNENEMLEALILDLRHLPEPYNPGPRLGRMLDAAKAARAALAKAEGREVSP
jgi:hypothetical protein